MSDPAVPFRHLQRLTDHVGLLEHAAGIVPRYEHGYCVDDVARGLVVVCREPAPSQELITLGRRYLYFLARAQAPDGRFRNRLGYDRRWQDQPGIGDCWGRSLWGLGTAAARGPAPSIREEAIERFGRSAKVPSPWPHAMAFAALGAVEVLEKWPDHADARTVLDRAISTIGEPPVMPAGRGRPQAQLRERGHRRGCHRSRRQLDRGRVLRYGLRMLDWLLTTETRDGHLSVVPAGGWSLGEPRPAFDQQPIEVAALADACMRAAAVTGDRSWLAGAQMAVAWFLGDNDAKIPLLDERTGGGCDGLSRTSRSRNQGAESTLAMISVMQQSLRLATVPQ